jgi:hypothetical protein
MHMPTKLLLVMMVAVLCHCDGCRRPSTRQTGTAAVPVTTPAPNPGATSATRPVPAKLQKFHYVGSYLGTPVVEGTLQIQVAPTGTVTGLWELALTPSANEKLRSATVTLGPQIGQGELGGEVARGQIFLRTTTVADYEVIFVSTHFDPNEIRGTWQFRTDAGVEKEGTFRATQ